MATFGRKVWTESLNNMWPCQKIAPRVVHELNALVACAQNSETNICSVARQWKGPCVSREEVVVKPHVQSASGTSGDIADVLAERMPFTEISGR